MQRPFVIGIPGEIEKELRSFSKVEICGLSTLIEKEKAIVSVGDYSFISKVLRSNDRRHEVVLFSVIRSTIQVIR